MNYRYITGSLSHLVPGILLRKVKSSDGWTKVHKSKSDTVVVLFADADLRWTLQDETQPTPDFQGTQVGSVVLKEGDVILLEVKQNQTVWVSLLDRDEAHVSLNVESAVLTEYQNQAQRYQNDTTNYQNATF